ncbi:MAG: gamma carbonic anhydrase family protein [SAR202 cluster bacterium]|nr:gamma carbonic anhydrase family protein [SAR202 cluster bacterium]
MIRALGGKSPRIDPIAYVSEAAYVIGDVSIGAHPSVWPGAVIRGDHGHIAIGSRTNIQDNSVIHSDADVVIGDHVTIGHRVVCHAVWVGNYVLLGNGCVVNDGVVVGSRAIVAAGAVVLERAARNYVDLAARYKAEGLE